MLRKRNYIRVKEQRFRLLGVVPNYCLVVLFFFFFALGQLSAFATTPKEECVTHKDFTCLVSEDLFTSSHHPLHLPFESDPSRKEPDASDENEREDNFDDDWNQLIWKHSSASTFNVSSSVKSHFFRISQSLQKRSTVPLFILYHSWKSFLLN